MRAWVVVACVVTVGCGAGGSAQDMSAAADLRMPGPDLAVPGLVGDACTTTEQCHEGATPVCWKATLFNKAGKLKTPGGYCSSMCTGDSDCGSAHCVDHGADGMWCDRACAAPTECRTGYACFTFSGGSCFPSDNLNCDPTAGDGTCTGHTPESGGCERHAIGAGTTGSCLDGCLPGAGSCPPSGGQTRHCVALDLRSTSTGDKFHGPVCLNTSIENAVGSECVDNGTDYVDACVDGAACYLTSSQSVGDNLCHSMCIPGADAGDPCGAGTCTDVWGLFGSDNPAGLCL